MLIFSEKGFLHISRSPANKEVHVASNDREDLVRLVRRLRTAASNGAVSMLKVQMVSIDGGETYEEDPKSLIVGGLLWRTEILETPRYSYRFRVVMPDAAIQLFFGLLVSSINYTSFEQHMNETNQRRSELSREDAKRKSAAILEVETIVRERWGPRLFEPPS
jgi:hypothetical protein